MIDAPNTSADPAQSVGAGIAFFIIGCALAGPVLGTICAVVGGVGDYCLVTIGNKVAGVSQPKERYDW